MAAGIFVLVRSGIAGHGRQAQIGGWLAAVGYAVTIPGELVLVLVADATSNSDSAGGGAGTENCESSWSRDTGVGRVCSVAPDVVYFLRIRTHPVHCAT